MNNLTKFAVLALLLVTSWHNDASAGNLIVNGGFETGDFTGWTVANDTDINGVDSSDPHSGTYEAFFGQLTADGLISISQSVTTIPEQSYTLSFWVMAEPGSGFSGAPDEFRASFNGNVLLDLVNVSQFPYTEYSYTVTALSTSSIVQFAAANDASFFALDDISLTPTASVPEPTSMIPLGIGMVTLAGYSVYRGKREQ